MPVSAVLELGFGLVRGFAQYPYSAAAVADVAVVAEFAVLTAVLCFDL